ncbi:acetyltransferase (isoleucine patch superfamily) [Schinkia azotoformans MEV2011]|uniref:Acetyltransferase (Isoleucine patch superfamily) n=1 Tax=Schinkia azotoformans MEV2011 TaxID=1348973 RepID=A0A072NNN3_SCHAZ|nr:acyltransferase [Schinkia azotoformans]KEF38872.1 acetyltransferase (isoleucine patch superfamily) [Schinkia azotoformans MEV2011]MEC1696775.1 acyltransferase [Schinkia azotoformans]MEC1725016.1 acyltransferase [Schinkia azotoformans]MEC1741749.1 acyltransferase [Schinkia azotoformans]MEC1766573.1 acyltransferase [Schinkia azotoformans]
MEIKRLWHTLRLCLIRNGYKRAEYAKRKGIYNNIGENVMIQSRKVPLYSQLIRFHNNIQVASNVTFLTHDVTHNVIKKKIPNSKIPEKIGCIEIMDNVFIGSNSTILYNIRIGPNSLVAAGSVVTKDVPPNTVVGGNPARVLGTFNDYLQKRSLDVNSYPENLKPVNQRINSELAEFEWKKFDAVKSGK